MAKKKSQLPSWSEIETFHKGEATGPDFTEFFGQGSKEDGAKSDFEIAIPNDVQTELRSAPTTNPNRPRALTIGYSPNERKLIVVFRDNTWWEYRNVPAEMWVALKASKSTGKYLRESGLDNWGDMGPANQTSLSESTKVRFSQASMIAGRIQSGIATLNDFLFGKR